MAVENFTRLDIDCDRMIASEVGLPELPLPVPFVEALGKIHAGRDLMAEQEVEADAVWRYGGWLLHVKSLRLLPQGVEMPPGLSSPFVVAVVRWPDCWLSLSEAEMHESVRCRHRRLVRRTVGAHTAGASII